MGLSFFGVDGFVHSVNGAAFAAGDDLAGLVDVVPGLAGGAFPVIAGGDQGDGCRFVGGGI